jgi:4-aminobutyrate aminotransferase
MKPPLPQHTTPEKLTTTAATNPGPTLPDFRGEGDLNHSPARRAWAAEHVGAKARQLLEQDAAHFLHQSLSTPCLNVLRHAEGAWIEDIEGRRYLDFHGNCVHQVGFAHPKVIAAIKHQLDELCFCPRRYTCQPAIDLAARLTSLAPGNLKRVLFAPGGTTAVGMALKYARVATGRFKFVSLWDSFHGASLDAISVGGEAAFRHGIGPLLPGCEHVPPPEPMRCPFRCGKTCNLTCADYLEYVLEKEGDVAAVIAETVRNTPFIPPPEYWQRIRKACDRHGTLLILDEIPIGLGRSGRLFAFEHYNIIPDMVVLGKGLGGGIFPLAALLARDDLDVGGEMVLGHYTHEKNPVACAAALATLDVLRDEALPERARELGAYALERLHAMATRQPLIADVRGLGLLLGIELGLPSQDGERRPAVAEAEQVMYECLKRELSFKVTMGNVLTLTPALTITKEELDRAFAILEAAIAKVTTGFAAEPA